MKRRDITDQMVCQAVADWRSEDIWNRYHLGGFIEGLLMERTGAPLKVVMSAMERTDRRGYIDYGVSLRTAWLTDTGEQLLAQQKPDNTPPTDGESHG
jgi:hypothetical protein